MSSETESYLVSHTLVSMTKQLGNILQSNVLAMALKAHNEIQNGSLP